MEHFLLLNDIGGPSPLWAVESLGSCIRKQLTIIMNEVTKLRDSRGTGWTGMRRRRGVSDVSTVHIYEILKK